MEFCYCHHLPRCQYICSFIHLPSHSYHFDLSSPRSFSAELFPHLTKRRSALSRVLKGSSKPLTRCAKSTRPCEPHADNHAGRAAIPRGPLFRPGKVQCRNGPCCVTGICSKRGSWIGYFRSSYKEDLREEGKDLVKLLTQASLSAERRVLVGWTPEPRWLL